MADTKSSQPKGNLNWYEGDEWKRPYPVRNDVAQEGNEVVVLRYWKVKKGAFPAYLKARKEAVWPYFEKLGCRPVGMWKVTHPEIPGGQVGVDSPDYDEIYLMTRYASVEHWKATRETFKHGGNGPDWEKCMKALEELAPLTLETSLTFLEGCKWDSAPHFMPALDERFK